MNKEEVQSYLNVGNDKEVVVDISTIEELGGMVRTTKITSPSRVSIEFDSWGYDEGGIYFKAEYPDLDKLIPVLEIYLGKDIASWENFTKTGNYPNKLDVTNLTPDELAEKFKVNTSLLPDSGKYTLHSDYWKPIIETIE